MNNWAENWEMVFDTAACRSPWTPDLLMVVSVSGRSAACVRVGDGEKQRGIQSLPFNQRPSPLRAALMEMPGGAQIETGLQEPGGGKARSSCPFNCKKRRRERFSR